MRTEPAAFWTSALSPISPCQTYLMWPVMMPQVPVLSSIPARHWSERAPERIEWKHTPSDVSNRSQLVNFMQSALVTRFLSSAESIGSHDRWFPGLRSQRWQNSRGPLVPVPISAHDLERLLHSGTTGSIRQPSDMQQRQESRRRKRYHASFAGDHGNDPNRPSTH